ncbi:hypothetical protein I7I51_05020 [Histoplasma capsulatum]|uniref:Uncharacterized protein n=1 Tax=Ajellomyces capsulatus TaxID=5037 RepID=A0A8A1M646_AJECA|nr:hypothetical protein I7I51_05020 [Histoplasma capsulatum]
MGRWGPIALHETDNNKQSPRETGKSKATPDLGKRSLHMGRSESRGHFPSAITNPTRSSPLLAGVLDNISLELCEPFNPKSGTPRSLERQGEAGWSRAASRVIDFESYPQSSYESPSELDLLQF